jgi:tRNA nucleotidyltransferase/poly(A) polymerase
MGETGTTPVANSSGEDESQRAFARSIVVRLREAGFEAYWAGGCVRDQLLGRTAKDYDVATNAVPDEVRRLFGRRRTLAIGASFGVVTVLGSRGLQPVEVAAFRTDVDYVDGRRPTSVEFVDARHDAQRRDFTINGLFYDPLADRIIDYVGGEADLRAGVVRAIGDPAARFAEDKLRLLRAVRFAAALSFRIEPATLSAIQATAAEVAVVSGERIGAEMRRLLSHGTRRRGVELLAEAKLIEPVLPELASAAHDDDPRWRCALERLERLSTESFSAALAALLVDTVAADGLRPLVDRWKLSNKESAAVRWILEQLPSLREARSLPWPRLQRILTHERATDLVAVAEADLPPGDDGVARCREVLSRPASQWNPPPLVTGDDLVEAGLSPGRRFAEVLERLRDEQLLGKLTSREASLAAAKAWIEQRSDASGDLPPAR